MAVQNVSDVKAERNELLTSGTAKSHLNLDRGELQHKFDREPFEFTHNLSDLDLFNFDSLQDLAAKFAGTPRDYFIAGGAPCAGTKFYSVPNGGFSPCEALEKLENGHHRVLLKRPENHDRRFRDLLETLFRQIAYLQDDLRNQDIPRLESAILISSSSTITPIHFDPEVGFFSQIEGEKLYHVYPPSCACETDLERFYIRGRVDIGNMDMSGLDSAHEHTYRLAPGKGFHQPQNSPHWVETCGSRSVSYTFVFQTRASRSMGRTRAFNYCLRKTGVQPAVPGTRPALDAIKAKAMHTAVPFQLGGRIWNKACRVAMGQRLSRG